MNCSKGFCGVTSCFFIADNPLERKEIKSCKRHFSYKNILFYIKKILYRGTNELIVIMYCDSKSNLKDDCEIFDFESSY